MAANFLLLLFLVGLLPASATGLAYLLGTNGPINALARAAAGAAGAAFIDITDLSRIYPDELADDGLHPDARQYARWVERIAPVARHALR